ncbi:LysR substrate-binding domain-containing protein [Verminephrobacter aporrectodeae]|uniref:LysR substrate-binding domain-containing protein n=1 Tax=Verminephrobacter aporrectodeae TaxID=1110389 RepID=UPI0022430CA7|nr:LysR substrate-binding domain-containing protein [Verminephrobacter aporrectodeae]
MDRRCLPLNALRAFEATGKHLSVTAAANSLFVSQSAISRHILALEAQLGIKLFERKHQHLELTQAGRMLLPVVNKSFDRIEQTLKAILDEGAAPRRVLQMQMPPTFAHNLAVPILCEFRDAFPDIMLDLTISNRVGMSENNGDIVVVYSKPEVNDLIADLLWHVRLTPLCHPSLLERRKASDLEDLLAHNDIVHVQLEGQPRHRLWEHFMRQAELHNVSVNRGLVFDTASLAAQYAMSGTGVALLDPLLFLDELRRNALVQPFDAWVDDGYGYYLLTHSDDLMDDAIASFRSWMIKRFSGLSLQNGALVVRRKASDLEDLLAHNDIVHVQLEGQPRHRLWEHFMRQAELHNVSVNRGLVFDTASLAAQYAMSGTGVALLDPLLFLDELRRNALVQPFDAWVDDGYGYYLLTHSDDLMDDAIASFRSWMIKRFSGLSLQNGALVVPPCPR